MKATTLALLIYGCSAATAGGPDDYVLGPDSNRQPGVPQGRIEGPHVFKSEVFAGIRQYWVYVPAQYEPAKPAAVMAFQDGHKYVNTEQEYRVPIVFDNLIHRKEMPVTIGVFVSPGHVGTERPADRGARAIGASNTIRLARSTRAFYSTSCCPKWGSRTS